MKILHIITASLCCGLAFVGTTAAQPQDDVSNRYLVSITQSYLEKLGYSAGGVDGVYGQKTQRALEAFYSTKGTRYQGEVDAQVIDDLKAQLEADGVRPSAVGGYEIAGLNIAIDYAPLAPALTANRYAASYKWSAADFNADGRIDILYTGAMQAENYQYYVSGWRDWCGEEKCEGSKYGPTLYIQNEEGQFEDHFFKVIDKRSNSGISLPAETLLADFNADGYLDIFVVDAGIGAKSSASSSYFLSQPDTTWLESSSTHLAPNGSAPQSRDGAVGDIDNDGDIDAVLLTDNSHLLCWINNGDGSLRRKNCGEINAQTIELGDVDGDGLLDIVYSGNENDGVVGGVATNDGTGSFMPLWSFPKSDLWPNAIEIAVWDLDKDGDLDVVISRTQDFFAGVAIEVLENFGKGEFVSGIVPIVIPEDGFWADSMFHELNHSVYDFRFPDVDGDGHTDILIVGGGDQETSALIRGAILKNLGQMKFTHLPRESGDNPVGIYPASLFVASKSGIVPGFLIDEVTAGHPTPERAFAIFILDQQVGQTSRDNHTLIDKPIVLPVSEARVHGFSQVNLDKNGGTFRALIEWAGRDLAITLCVEHDARARSTKTLTRFAIGSFGGIAALNSFGVETCNGSIGYASSADIPDSGRIIGVRALLEDLESALPELVRAMRNLTSSEKNEVLSGFL